MKRHLQVAALTAMTALITGCTGIDNPGEAAFEEPGHAVAISAMQDWTEFCDKAEPTMVTEHFGATVPDVTEDAFTGTGVSDGVAAGRCGGTFDIVPGNSASFQVALRAHSTEAQARASVDEWRASTIAQSPAPQFQVGSPDSDTWIAHSAMGTTAHITGSVLHGFYRITLAIGHPIYDETDDCGADIACTPTAAEALSWLEGEYLPALIETVDSHLPVT